MLRHKLGNTGLAWVMARPGITSAIASGSSVEQVQELLNALDVKLTREEMSLLDEVSR